MEPINYVPSLGGFPRSFIGAWVNISQIGFIIKLNINFTVSQTSYINKKRIKSFSIFITLSTIIILKDSSVVALGQIFPPIQLYSINFANMLLLLNCYLSH